MGIHRTSSPILRKLALESILAESSPREAFGKLPYLGVYLSCSAELRSRFLLFPTDEYESIAGDAVEFFMLLLSEALVRAPVSFGTTGSYRSSMRAWG